MVQVVRRVFGFAFFVMIVAGAYLFWDGYQFTRRPLSSSEDFLIFEVQPGESPRSVGRRLEQLGLISSARKFELFARYFPGRQKPFRVGEYKLRQNMTPLEIIDAVTSGRSIEYAVTFQEGLNVFEIAELLERERQIPRQEFLHMVMDREFVQELVGEKLPSLEGYLFPDTYHITKFTGTKGLIRMMVDKFLEHYTNVKSLARVGLNRHELVTLASIVEKETGAPEERPVISSVFHNRLRLNMRLQTDPTVIYGLWVQTGTWNRNITRNDLQTPTDYNTYTFSGLPKGPIANPGLKALLAAADPARTDYLFFVSRNDGTHVFSKTYAQHQRAVAEFQLNRKAREGRSWRDLNKREQVPRGVTEAPVAGSLSGSSTKKQDRQRSRR